MKRLLRRFLALILLLCAAPASAQAHLTETQLAAMPVPPPTEVEAYGTGPLQFGELRVPAGNGPFPVAIIVHGGCWTKGFATLRYMSPLAADLARKGIATWSIEYRQIGDAGAGWPGTFLDWAEGADYVRRLAGRYHLDLTRVVLIGHSAGAHAVLWLANRERLPNDSAVRGSGVPIVPYAVFAIDGPADIAGSFLSRETSICRSPVIEHLMGGTPAAVPSHYAQGNPRALLPSAAPETLVSSVVLTAGEATDYQSAATKLGGRVTVVNLTDAGHFDMLSVDTPSGLQVERLILHALGLTVSGR
jgi:acetyl esterase/lipase